MDLNTIKEIVRQEIQSYVTEQQSYFTIVEYENFKQGFEHIPQMQEFFREIDSQLVEDDIVKKEHFVDMFSGMFMTNSSQKNRYAKSSNRVRKNIDDLRKKIKKLDERFTSKGIRENSVLHFEIVSLNPKVRLGGANNQFKVKFMFENSLSESRRFDLNEKQIDKFNLRVKSPDSILYIQLIGYNTIGSGKIELLELKDQKRVIHVVELMNDESKVVGEIRLNMLWIYSFKELYSTKIDVFIKEQEEIVNNEKEYAKKLENICTVVPGLRSQLADGNLMQFGSISNFKFNKNNKIQFTPFFIMVILMLLIVTNVMLALCFPNLAELMIIFLFLVLMKSEALQQNIWLFYFTVFVLIVKDVIVYLFYLDIDYVAMVRTIDNEGTLFQINKIVIWVNLGLKVALVMLSLLLNKK